MQKRTCLLAGILSFTHISFSQNLVIKGKINTRDSAMIILFDGVKADTVITSTGYFYFTRKTIGLPMSLSNLDMKGKLLHRTELFANSGEVSIDTNYALTLSHPELQIKYEKFKKRYDQLVTEKNSITRKYFEKKLTTEERIFLDSLDKKVMDSVQIEAEGFILKNRDNELGAYVFAGYLVMERDVKKLETIYNSFDNKLYSTSYALQMMKTKIEAMHKLVPGKPIQGFKAITLNDKDVSTETLKGKYAVLDFWGTWCAACVMDLPKMKQYYDKYKDRIEFVSIACRDEGNQWREAIKKYNLPWTQVLNIEQTEGLEKKYDIVNYPTKILIDPNGNLIKIYIGGVDDFYAKIDELLGYKMNP